MNGPDQRAEQIFAAVIEITDPAERRAYMERACAGDARLRAEVESLVAAHEQAGEFLQTDSPEQPTVMGGTVLAAPLTENPGTRIGRYKLLEQIGEGGFGVVWMAEQEEPVRRRVALKITNWAWTRGKWWRALKRSDRHWQ